MGESEQKLKNSELKNCSQIMEQSKCLVCFENISNIIFLPCRHMAIDLKCFTEMKSKKGKEDLTCIVCREKIEKVVLFEN